ncbi:hypothetical protein ABI59_17985 [Acidobacteria bacterium Mor1]|nr:hypothetical protein ABI59_17985 [Acidobacteria bacterium Mor1]
MDSGGTLALHRFCLAPGGPAVLAVHGSISNGRMFYSNSGRGLAPFLARRGFDVYVLDYRGRGESRPSVREFHDFDQRDLILEDIPRALQRVRDLSGRPKVHALAHSWGGVLLLSALGRQPDICDSIASVGLFATKRVVHVRGVRRLFALDMFWKGWGLWVSGALGYLPARALRAGSDDESFGTHRDCVTWVRPGAWVDPTDGFDYAGAWRDGDSRPRLRAWAAINDAYLGHPEDCRVFLEEAGYDPAGLIVLSRANGQRQDYDHINLLTHPDAESDLYPQVEGWIGESPA